MADLTPARLQEIADCPCCRGSGIEEVYAGHGDVAEIVCSVCDGKAEFARALLAKTETCDAAVALLREAAVAIHAVNAKYKQSVLDSILDFLAQQNLPTAPDATISGAETEKGSPMRHHCCNIDCQNEAMFELHFDGRPYEHLESCDLHIADLIGGDNAVHVCRIVSGAETDGRPYEMSPEAEAALKAINDHQRASVALVRNIIFGAETEGGKDG